MGNRIYLDNAATTPMDSRVVEVMTSMMNEVWANPSSIHQDGVAARSNIEEARLKIASLFKAEPSEIFFTSGATESINLLIKSVIDGLKISRIITSQLEHPAVLESVRNIALEKNVPVTFIPFDIDGHINLSFLEQTLGQNPNSLVALMHANNELGNLLPLKKVANLCHENGAYFFSDTVQSVGKFPMDFSQCFLDFAVGSAHKFHGAKGIGFLYIRKGIKINPLLFGGAQERNMRAGTENLPAIVGMAEALRIAYSEMPEITKHLTFLKEFLVNRIKDELPFVEFNGDINGIHSIINLALPLTHFKKMIIFSLDVAGISVSGGSACSSGVMNISHVIKALGRDKDYVPVRISFSKYNSLDDVNRLVDLLIKYGKKMV
ncbi:MAG: cysteine desulfurase [Bacteroidales bacterium]|nr:cysteine desulfurase [Bacteroidales bacterium]